MTARRGHGVGGARRALAPRVATVAVGARRALAVLVATLVLGSAGWSAAQRTVSTEHVRVVFDPPRLEPMARRAAADAERALARISELFGIEPFPVVLLLGDVTDAFNAVATPIPRPTAALRAVAPLEETIGLGARSWLELVVVHELTHLAHFTGTGGPSLGLGLVGEGVAPPPPQWVTEGIATWVESELTEGGRRDDAGTAGLLATLSLGSTWPTLAEASTSTHDAWPGSATRYLLGAAFLDALVAEHGWDAVVAALRAYGGAPLHRTFAGVWRDATGADLHDAWSAWREAVAADAASRRARLPPPPERLTETGWDTGLPTVSPSGRYVAWRTHPAAVRVARIGAAPDGSVVLEDATTHLPGARIGSLDWLDEDTLAYTRLDPTATSTWSEVFSLDVTTGRSVRWTRGARAHFVRAEPGSGCVRFVRALPGEPSAVVRACPDGILEPVWTAPAGSEIVGFDVAADGRMAVSIWDRGTTGVAVLAPTAPAKRSGEGPPATGAGTPRARTPDATPAAGSAPTAFRTAFVTRDRFLDLDPVWTASGAIRFRSDRTGRFEIWEAEFGADPGAARLNQRTDTLGGAFQPASETFVVVLGAEGFDLAQLPEAAIGRAAARRAAPRAPDPGTPGQGAGRGAEQGATSDAGPDPVRPAGPAARAAAERDASEPDGAPDVVPAGPPAGPVAEPYAPWASLAPVGWLPTAAAVGRAPARVALEAQAYGQDAAARHAYALTLGVDTALTGTLGPAYASARWTHLPDDRFAAFAPTRPYTLSVEAGAWPHAPHLGAVRETALGVRGMGTVRFRGAAWAAAARLRVGLVHLRSSGSVRPDARLDAVLTTSGADRWGYPGAGVRVDAAGRWTPTPTVPSAGAWGEAAVRGDAFGGSLAAAVRAGWRQQPPVPLALDPLAATLTASGRWHVPVALRYGDGRYALERVTLTPAVRGWLDGSGVGLGADLTVGADLLLSYAAPVTVHVQGGWSQRPWIRAGIDFGF